MIEKLQAGKPAAVLPMVLILSVIACPPQNVSVSNIMNAQKDDSSVLTIRVGSSFHIGKLVVGAQYRFYVKVYRASNFLELIYGGSQFDEFQLLAAYRRISLASEPPFLVILTPSAAAI